MFDEPCDVSAPMVMNTENAALRNIHESLTKFGLIHLWDSLRGAVVAIFISEKSNIRMKAHFTQKNVEKLASQCIYLEKFHIYISLYVARLRNITLPSGLGIHDANKTSGGRTPSFSILTP